jgi:aryl-alcohol dehydrogenase-like predicted oxidoreductase
MKYRGLGRLNWQVSEVGYGMWGIAGGPGNFTGANLETAPACLDLALELGCNFFDTAWVYGRGVSEQMLGRLLRSHAGKKIYVATKVPPKNREWPPRAQDKLDDVFPADHIREYTQRSLENLGVDRIDLLQLHVWEDRWAQDEQWQRTLSDLRAEGLIDGIGISVNRWEPENCLKAIDTGLIDVIQVIYNIFDQAPQDRLFKVAAEKNVGIIARVPFDEGGLSGALTRSTVFPPDDWRSTYFGPENLLPTVERAEALKRILPAGVSLPELSLRFILDHPAVSTVIPGMRQKHHVQANMAVSDGVRLQAALREQLHAHRWDRKPTAWSQ